MNNQKYVKKLHYYLSIVLKSITLKVILFTVAYFLILIISKKFLIPIDSAEATNGLASTIIPLTIEEYKYELDPSVTAEIYSDFLEKNKHRKYFVVAHIVDPNRDSKLRTEFYYKVRVDICICYPDSVTWLASNFDKMLFIINKTGLMCNEFTVGYYFLATDELPTLTDFHKGLKIALQNLPNNYKVEDKSIISLAYENKIPYRIYDTDIITNFKGENPSDTSEAL